MEDVAYCPLCNRKGPTREIETHAATCEGPSDVIVDENEFRYDDEDAIKCYMCGGTDLSVLHPLEVRAAQLDRSSAQAVVLNRKR